MAALAGLMAGIPMFCSDLVAKAPRRCSLGSRLKWEAILICCSANGDATECGGEQMADKDRSIRLSYHFAGQARFAVNQLKPPESSGHRHLGLAFDAFVCVCHINLGALQKISRIEGNNEFL